MYSDDYLKREFGLNRVYLCLMCGGERSVRFWWAMTGPTRLLKRPRWRECPMCGGRGEYTI